jgi:hypothetical protein
MIFHINIDWKYRKSTNIIQEMHNKPKYTSYQINSIN